MKLALAAVVVALVSCSDREKPAERREPERPRRVIDPPSRGVRALPPHAIRADGIGPFKLGATVTELLDQLPSGPRITQFSIPGVVHRDMLRAEDDAIVIATEPQGKATSIAVVRSDIARTESGIQVGSTRAELAAKLGAPVTEPDRARDPRLVVSSALKNARAVLEGETVVALLVAGPTPDAERAAKDPTTHEPACTRPAGDPSKRVVGVCFTHAGDLVRMGEDELVLLAKDGERAIATARVPGLVWAGAVRNPSDGKDDLVAIAKSDDTQSLAWSLLIFRGVDNKLLRTTEPVPLFQISSANARWVGAEIGDLDLYLEVAARADSIEVGGLLTRRGGAKIADIVAISPLTVSRRRGKLPAHDAIDAGTSDVLSGEAPSR